MGSSASGSSSQGPAPWSGQPLSRVDVSVGSYLVARSLIGQPIPDEHVDPLRRANATLDETRSALEHGRGNIASDARRSGYQVRYRASAARRLGEEKNREFGSDAVRHVAHSAAAALALGAGRCGEYACVSTALHAARMTEDERVHIMDGPGHNWCEVRGDASIVMDGWLNGTAVLASDSVHASRVQVSAIELDRDGATEALHRARTLEQGLREDPQDLQQRIDRQVPYAASLLNWMADQLAPRERGVASNELVRSVSRHLQDGGSRATAAHAVRVARSLGSSPATLHEDIKRLDEATRTHFGGG